ncbi:hypothetical protein ACP70R_047952 [Stipagrostis hirtigluma subsp. patula]
MGLAESARPPPSQSRPAAPGSSSNTTSPGARPSQRIVDDRPRRRRRRREPPPVPGARRWRCSAIAGTASRGHGGPTSPGSNAPSRPPSLPIDPTRITELLINITKHILKPKVRKPSP